LHVLLEENRTTDSKEKEKEKEKALDMHKSNFQCFSFSRFALPKPKLKKGSVLYLQVAPTYLLAVFSGPSVHLGFKRGHHSFQVLTYFCLALASFTEPLPILEDALAILRLPGYRLN
jgi:hypothetical protein